MEDRRAEAMREATDAPGRVIESAHGAVSRAGAYVQERAGRASERARDLARDAREQLMRVRETSLPSWPGEVRSYLREHPLQAIVAMIAVGYVLGKFTRRA
jgi:ElaB/YqjD/DUF883 family membrane-anchored ribosome-binding protein